MIDTKYVPKRLTKRKKRIFDTYLHQVRIDKQNYRFWIRLIDSEIINQANQSVVFVDYKQGMYFIFHENGLNL